MPTTCAHRGSFGHAVAAAVLLFLSAPPSAHAVDWTSAGLDPAHSRASAERSGALFRAPAWTAAFPGAVWNTSSPAVADGILVFGTRDGFVQALKASTGRRLWQFKTGDSVLASPAVHRGRVYVPSLDNRLYALRLADGALVWKKDLGGLEQSSPTMVGDSIIVAGGFPSRRVLRIDAASGQTIWETSPEVMAQFSNSSAVSDGAQVVVGAQEGHLYSFDMANGAHRWTYEADGMVNVSAPVIVDGRVYLLPGGDSGRLHAVDLTTGKAVSGWPILLPAPAADPTVNGKLVTRQHSVSSLTAVPGRLLFDVRFDDSIDTGADAIPDKFVLREFLMAVATTDGRVIWQVPNGHRIVDSFNDIPKNWLCPTPAAYRGLGTAAGASFAAAASTLDPVLRILDVAGGTNRGSLTTPAPARMSPVLANGRLVIGTDTGSLHAYLSSSNRPPDAPVLLGLPGRSVSSVAPVIRWAAALDPEGDAVSYQVRVDDDGEVLETWDAEVITGVGETSTRLTRSLSPDSATVLAVRARDVNGAWSDWSVPQVVRAVETPSVSVGGVAGSNLAAALASAAPGVAVSLGAGTFHLTETLRVPAGVTLEGAGPGQTILDGTGQATAISMEGTADGPPTELRKLTVTGARVGVSVRDSRDARITNVVIRDNTETGVEVGAAGSATLKNGTLAANGRAVRSFGTITVKNSLVTGNQTGFVSDHPGSIVSAFNDLFGNPTPFSGMTQGRGDLASTVAFANYAKRDLRVMRGQASTDQGDPADDFALEPAPNGGRVNLGAFGGTAESELSALPPPAPPDPAAPQPGGGCSVASPGSHPDGSGSWGLAAPVLVVLLAMVLMALRRRRAAAVVVLFACLASARPSSAVVCTFQGTGGSGGVNWSTSARWNVGGTGGSGTTCPPGPLDSAVFNTGSRGQVVDVDVNVGSITITSGFTGSIAMNSGIDVNVVGDYNQAGATFTGSNGRIDIGGDFILSSGAFTSTSDILSVGDVFNKTGGTFTHNSGRVLLAATSGTRTFASNGATFYDLAINDGLLGYWKFDDTASPSVDASGWGRNAAWTSTPVASATVPTLNFNNSRSLGIDSAADVLTYTNSPAAPLITVAAWIRATAIGGGNYQRILEQPGYVLFIGSASLVAPDNPMALALTSNRATTSGEFKSPPNSLTYGAWYHIAVTYDSTSTSNVAVMYINGVSQTVTTRIVPVGAQDSNVGTATIGNRTAGDRYFNGLIDDLRIYNRILSASEINTLAIGNQPGTSAATQTLSGAPIIAHDLIIASGTLAAGTNTVTVGGSWWNYGGLYTTGTSGMVTFNGSGATNKVLSAGSMFQDVTFNGAGTWTLADRMEIDPVRNLAMTAGTFDLSSYTLRTGDIGRNGAVTITPSTGLVVLGSSASRTVDAGTFNDLRFEPVAATNLVGYWKLDEGAGPTTRDYGSGASDGTLTAGPFWVRSGLPTALKFENAGALDFNGSSQFIDIPTPATPSNASFTACAWMKLDVASGHQVAISIDGTNISGFYVKRDNSGEFSVQMRSVDNTTSTLYFTTGTTTAVVGTWYHVCGSFTTSDSKIRLYVNGTLEGTPATVGSTWNATGHTIIGASKWSGARADFMNGKLDDVRIYNTALSATQIAALASGTYPAGLAGIPTYTLGYATTVAGAFSLDNGTLATGAFSMNASSASNVAAVYSGTYSVGSTTHTFAGGLTVDDQGTLALPTSGGTVKIGSTKTLTMDGTLNASSTGAIIQTAGAASTYYNFNVGSSATATPTLNITGLQVKNTTTNGMYINAVAGSATTFTRFDNIAFSGGTGLRLLQIYAPSLYLVSNGCSFDSGASSGTTTKNVTLRGDGSATETRVAFGGATCLNGSSPTYSLCEANDDDDDSAADGVGDTTGSNAAVVQWVHSAMADTSGTIEGFPTAAFDWNSFVYYSTYVLYHDVAGGTTDRLYVRDTNGVAKYYWDAPSGANIIGAPRFDTVLSVHYVYVATTSGLVYRLIDTPGSSTLVPDAAAPWSGTSYDCSCAITTPLAVDGPNIYWGGTQSAANKVWTLPKATKVPPSSSPFTVTAVVSGAAPAVWISGSTYIFMGSLGHFYKVNVSTQQLTTDNNAPLAKSANVNGRISIINSKVYGADDAGTLWVLDPATFSTTLWSYHDNTNHNNCAAGTACAITSPLYVDFLLNRAFYGDGDGHLYASYNSTGTTGAQLTNFPYYTGSASDVFASAPLYESGILVAGTTTGKVLVIDVNGGSGPVLKQTYKFGASTKISGIGYDRGSTSYMISTADTTAGDGKLIYIDKLTDPTPGSN